MLDKINFLSRIKLLSKKFIIPFLFFVTLMLLTSYVEAVVDQASKTSSSKTSLSLPPLPQAPAQNMPSQQIPLKQVVLQNPASQKTEPVPDNIIVKKQATVAAEQESAKSSYQGLDEQNVQSVQPSQNTVSEESSTALANRVENLEQFYRQNQEDREKFTSTSYVLKVFGTLGILLALFYLAARFIVPNFIAASHNKPITPFGKNSNDNLSPSSTKPLLGRLFSQSQGQEKKIKLQMISRLRVAPGKEIQVVQFGEHQLVVGITAQNMTLLADISPDEEESTHPAIFSDAMMPKQSQNNTEKAIYQKYLSKRSSISSSGKKSLSPNIPEKEEVYLLDDYEDQYES